MPISLPSLPTSGSIISGAKKAVSSLKSSITNQIKDLGSVYGNHKDPTKDLPADMFYPDYLNDENGKYPCIRLSTVSDPEEGKKFFSIYLPCPTGIVFSDAGTYTDINLGVIGNAQNDVASKILSGDFKGLGASVKGAYDQVTSLTAAEALAIASGQIGEDVKEKALFATKKIMAPNANAQFTGNEPRTFSFNFTAVVRSKEEAQAIYNIQRLLRRYVYAGADKGAVNIILSYPPVWQIEFLLDGVENPRLPKIYGCYLTSLGTTFNSGGPTWMADGSPLQTEIAVSFKETRTLNRLDIDMLERRAGSGPGSSTRVLL